MTPPASRAARVYGRLLRLLHGRDPEEQQSIQDDAERLLDAARERGSGTLAATWLGLMWDLLIAATWQDLVRALRSVARASDAERSSTTSCRLVTRVLLARIRCCVRRSGWRAVRTLGIALFWRARPASRGT